MTELKRSGAKPPWSDVQTISFKDLVDVLKAGLSDFFAAPLIGLVFGATYVAGGVGLVAFVMFLGMPWLAYPLVIGFALIGPFVATGFYEVSRRRESAQPIIWSEVFGVIWQQRRRELGWMAFVMLFVFWIWMYQVRTLVAVFFGSQGFATLDGFLTAVFATQNGWTFLFVGHVVGATIALVLYSLTVVSCPLLLERDVDFVTAMITSIKAVTQSPVPMIAWGLLVIACVVAAALPAFLGLLLVLPVFGHATWHLYRRILPPPG